LKGLRAEMNQDNDSGILPHHPNSKHNPVIKWLDRLWVVLLIILLVYTIRVVRSSRYCAYLGTDFRGYYAVAQIARQSGFADLYNQRTQEQYQAALSYRCPDGSYTPPLLWVSMPYLPVFVLIFIPLTFIDFTAAYFLWVTFNLAAVILYLRRFVSALGGKMNFIHILQWALCAPLFSNLVLGQMNVFLMVCLGEFVLAAIRERRYWSGLWLGGMLVKPHTLILLLPGLLLHKTWKTLLGFAGSALGILVVSVFLAGWDGVWSSVRMAAGFAGPLIQTGPAMMNFRALALNLESFLPVRLAWVVAICGMGLVAGFTLYMWKRYSSPTHLGFVILILTTLAATFAITWHSHFYMLLLLLPLLVALDSKEIISPLWRWSWIFGPPLYFGLLYLANPDQARNGFGLGMLALNLFLFTWGLRKLRYLS
jgi:hypothetical protein